MTKQEYYLLKLIVSEGEIRGRKRLQKLFYLLQYIGCPIEYRFIMHYYGPYSPDLALQVDSLVEKGLIQEDISIEIKYRATEKGSAEINTIDSIDANKAVVEEVSGWASIFRHLDNNTATDLEISSTILFWMDWGRNKEDAIKATSAQKKKPSESAIKITEYATKQKNACYRS